MTRDDFLGPDVILFEPTPTFYVKLGQIMTRYDFLLDEWFWAMFEPTQGGRRSPAVACWASDHWVASSNPLRGKFRH